MTKVIKKTVVTILLLCTALSFACFAACGVKFKVNFIVDGTVYSAIDTGGAEVIEMPQNPTKDGYTFDGWYWDKDEWQKPFTANSLLDAPLSSDMNVYCKWKADVINVESVSLSETEISMHADEEKILTATVLPANATDTSVVWESSNSTIATVVGGKITALRVGTATITATTTDGGKIAECTVYVEPILVESVSLNHTELTMLYGESKTLTATVLPKNATENGVTWHSSNASIVTVENGVLEAVGYGNATITVTTIDGDKTATCAVEVTEDKITFNTLTVDGEKVYGIVPNATTTFSFLKEIVEHGNAEYIVYKEITCETPITSQTISLNTGNNTVYVLQTVGKTIKLYTVTIRRRPMYTVTFNTNNGTAVNSQTIEESFCATEPTTTRTGYTFDKWDYNFNNPITNNTTITASWTANTNTAYKVEYYLQNLGNDEYTLTETVNKKGTTDTTATAEIKSFAHFTHKSSATDSGNIAPDGSTVLKVYYTRDKYTVTFDGNGGTLKNGDATQTVKYGGSVVAPSYERTGYTFINFDKSLLTNIDKSQTIKAQWKINQYTLTIVYNNGQEDKKITQDYNTAIASEANPSRNGYTFNGWDKTIPTKMPAKNLTITAKWLAIFTLSDGTITGVTDHGKTLTEIVIPSKIDGVKITAIGDSVFRGRSSLVSVTIGNSVTSIGYEAFYNCSSLTSITIGNSVMSIGEYAFRYCDSIENIYYNGDINDWVQIEGLYNLMYYSNFFKKLYINGELLTEANITTATKINDYAFQGCSSLVSVTIGNSVTSIGNCAFYKCSSLTSVTIPNSVTSIGNSAFFNCKSLTSVTIGNGVTSIGNSAFWNCSKLVEVINKSKLTITKGSSDNGCIGYYALNVKTSGSSEIVNKDDYLFYTCDSVNYLLGYVGNETSLTLPENFNGQNYKIHNYAFSDCSSLVSITIGNGVTSIGSYAFYDCISLTEINYNVTECEDLKYDNCVFYNAGKGGTGIKVTIGKNVEKIPAYLFYPYSSSYSPKITEVVFEEGSVCESIGDCAFRYCSSLVSVTIPNGVKSIGEYAFDNCIMLTSVTIPNSVKSIGDYAFCGCSSLKTIFCEAESEPEDWSSRWDVKKAHDSSITAWHSVVWDCKNK